ncbi:MAG TPA: hypothetical protein VJ488_05320 [Dehalococcoidia bacterium]|nr:hypothetical protein [Dehalococcoidia bacterium]
MVSTVTVTTVTTIAAMGLIATLSIFGVILLIALLTSRELLMASSGERKKFIGRTLNVSIIPLLLSFTVIVALKVIQVLG